MKIILKILLWVVVSAIAIFAGTAVFVRIYEDEIIDAVFRYCYEQHGIEVQKQHIELGLRAAFPFAVINAEQVRIAYHSSGNSQANFDIFAEQMHISVNVVKLFRDKKIDVRRIMLYGGEGKIRLPQKSEGKNAAALPMNIDIIEIEGFKIVVDDNAIDVEHFEVALRQNDIDINISASGSITLIKGKIADIHPILKMPAAVDLNMKFNGKQWEFIGSDIMIADSRIKFSGIVSSNSLTIHTESRNIKLERVGKLFLPLKSKVEKLKGRLNIVVDMEGEIGRMPLKINVSGQASKVVAMIEGREVTIASAGLHFNSANASDLREYICYIEDADIKVGNFMAQANGKINNFEMPRIKVDAIVAGELNELSNVFEQGNISGKINAEFYSANFDLEDIKGTLQINDAIAKIQGKDINFDGIVNLSTKSISTPDMKIKCDYIDGIVKGKIYNYTAMWQKNNMEAIQISGALSAQHINVDSILNFKVDDKSGQQEIKVKININSNKLLLFNYLYSQTSFLLQYTNDKILINNFKANVFDGYLNGNAKIIMTKQNNNFRSKFYFRDIQIDKIPLFNNYFKQGSLLGILSGQIDIGSPFNSEGINLNMLNGNFNFTIENGQMINFKPIQSLSDYLKKGHLENIYFLTLKNTLTISDGAIHIPKMEIRSSALNTYIEGKHYFNNDFDYHITLYFSELLRGKAHKLENPIKEGKSKVFLHAIQKDGKFKIDYDTDIGKNIKATLQKEQESLAIAKGKIKDKKTTQAINIDYEDMENEEPNPQKKSKKSNNEKEKPPVNIKWEDE